jgi:septal ring factor EnvC (AmiA/AmiB activator)
MADNISEQEFGEYKNRVKSVEHRVDDLEEVTKAIYTQNATLERIATQSENTNQLVKKHDEQMAEVQKILTTAVTTLTEVVTKSNDHESRLQVQEKQEGKKAAEILKQWKFAIISSLAGAIVTLVVGVIIWVIVQKGGV